MKYIRTTINFIGVWFVASLCNGLIAGTCISYMDTKSFNDIALGLALVFSLFCSLPLVGIVWLAAIIAQYNKCEKQKLLHVILATAICSGIAGALFYLKTFGTEFPHSKYAVCCSIIGASVFSTLIFRKQFKQDA
jgi:hypothetical protein